VLHHLTQVNPEARALYLFPTKALSQDQVLEARELAGNVIAISRFTPSTAIPPRPPAALSAIRGISW
jgi:ATP-dependent helicase YprA (DUF1998 family)